MYFVYVIESINFKKRYVGFSSDLENRLREHNNGETRSNKAYRPFRIIYFEEIEEKGEAIKRERYLKSCAGRRYILKIRPRSSVE